MKETAERLHNKVQTTATVKEDTAFYEQITQLVPWKVKQIQIARNPKVRRLPLQLMSQEAVTHRAAVLQLNTGHIQIETEVVDDIKRSPGARFDTAVAYAVFIFGEAPVTSYNPDDNAKPEESNLLNPKMNGFHINLDPRTSPSLDFKAMCPSGCFQF